MPSYTVPYAPTQTFSPNFRLVELLREQGSDAADAALRHGAIDAQLANTLGTIPGQMIVAQRAGQESQLRDQQMKAGAIDLAQKQKDADDRATMSRIMQAAYGGDPSQQPGFVGPTESWLPQAGAPPPGFEKNADGVILPSANFITQAMAKLGLGDHIPTVIAANAKAGEAVAALNKTKGEVAKLTSDALGRFAASAQAGIDAGIEPGAAFHFAAMGAYLNDAVTATQLKPYLDAVQQDPSKIPAILRALQGGSEAQQKIAAEVMTAKARETTARTQQFSDAGLTQQLTEARQKASGAPVAPLPGALPSAGGPPASLNADTGQPVIAPDDITGGSVNPIAPQLSPAAAPMLAGLPPGTPEAAVPPPAPVLSPAEIALAEHQRVKEAGMRMAPDATITIKTMVNGKAVERVLTKAQALAIGEFPSQPPAAIQVNNAIVAASANAPPVDATRPSGPLANTVDPRTGLTPNTTYQAALAFALQNTMPPQGLRSGGPQGAARNAAVTNLAGALAAAAGTDLPTLRAAYKANAATLTKLLPQATATANASNTMIDNLDLAVAKSAEVDRSGSKWVNHYMQWAEGNFTPAPGLAQLETYVYTAAREYAKVTSGGAAASQGLTDTAAREASKLLNAAQAGETFAAVVQAMKNDAGNVVMEQTKGLARVSSTIGNFFSVVNGGAVPTTAPATTPRPARRNPFE